MRLLHRGNLNNGKILRPRVIDCPWEKPVGNNILWTSPLNSVFGWLHWLAENEGEENAEGMDPQELVDGKCWVIDLSKETRIARVDSLAILKSLARRYSDARYVRFCLDWHRLAKDYDAFWLTRKGQRETASSYPVGLWGFDCETVVIFNTSIINGCAAYP